MRTVKSNADSLTLRMEMSTPFERTGRTSLELSNRLHLAPKEEKRKEKKKTNKPKQTNKKIKHTPPIMIARFVTQWN